jgi:hypothetical protein
VLGAVSVDNVLLVVVAHVLHGEPGKSIVSNKQK